MTYTPAILYHETAAWDGGDLLPLEARLGREAAVEEFLRRWPLCTRRQALVDIGLVYLTDTREGHGQGGVVLAIDVSKVPGGVEWFMHEDETDGGWVADRIPAEAITLLEIA